MRFTIRDLLWLVLLASVALGWLIDGRKQRTVIAQVRASEREIQGHLNYEHEMCKAAMTMLEKERDMRLALLKELMALKSQDSN